MPRAQWVFFLGGAVVWALIALAPTVTALPRVLLLAVWVIVPLALGLTLGLEARGSRALFQGLYLLAAVLVSLSFLQSPGWRAGGLALGWLMFTGCVALWGVARWRSLGRRRLEEWCVSVGMLYLVVGGVWLTAARWGVGLLGFGEPFVSLTAAHFHYAGFAALLLAAQTGRALRVRSRLFETVAVGLMAGMALVAAGITFSPLLEVLAAVAFAASMVGLVLVQWRYVVPGVVSRWAQGLFILSGLMGLWAMGAAVLYAVSEYTQSAFLLIPQMVRLHGEVNALGWVLLNWVGWGVVKGEK